LVDEVYAYSCIATNVDVSTPAKAAALEAWHRMRTRLVAANHLRAGLQPEHLVLGHLLQPGTDRGPLGA
jgi:hypothetical protein